LGKKRGKEGGSCDVDRGCWKENQDHRKVRSHTEHLNSGKGGGPQVQEERTEAGKRRDHVRLFDKRRVQERWGVRGQRGEGGKTTAGSR